jgi:hypothetical protein
MPASVALRRRVEMILLVIGLRKRRILILRIAREATVITVRQRLPDKILFGD